MEWKSSLKGAVPDGWLVKESMTFLSPDGRGNVIFSSEPIGDLTVEEYALHQGELLTTEFEHYTELDFRPLKVFGDRDGYVRSFQWAPGGPVEPVRQVQLYYAADGRGWTATATATLASFSEMQDAMLGVLDSLKF